MLLNYCKYFKIKKLFILLCNMLVAVTYYITYRIKEGWHNNRRSIYSDRLYTVLLTFIVVMLFIATSN